MERYLKRADEDSEGEASAANEPAVRKRKNCQKFIKDYTDSWPRLIPASRIGFARCTLCNCDFSVVHGGRDDCRRHISSKKHTDMKKVGAANQDVSSFFQKKDCLDTTKAECYFTRFVVEHNIPISVADHAGSLFVKMFPDSEIAKKYSCARTKTSALIRSMASDTKSKIIEVLKSQKFSLATDGSNDISDKKLYPLVVTFFDPNKSQVITTLLSLLESSDNTGKGIFTLIESEFSKLGIPWENCVSFSCDNANTMTGKIKGVSSFIKAKQPNIKTVGCPCHLIHINAQKATRVLPVDVEMLVVQVYYYLEKSSKRKSALKECQNLCGEKAHKILKHVNTRWLSLENALNRLIEQWEPLKMFIAEISPSNNNQQFCVIKELFDSSDTKLYCLFVQNIISTFTKTNVLLQKEQPLIHALKAELHKFYFELVVRFIKPSAISKSENVFDVEYWKRNNQKSDEELVIGVRTKSYLNDANLEPEKVSNFFLSVRKFFTTACDYALKKLPMHDEFYSNAEIANVSLRATSNYKSAKYFAELFNYHREDIDNLELEFALYQCDVFTPDITISDKVDEQWVKISNIKYPDGTFKYERLSKLMLSLLVVPHSNAPTERVFSLIRKNQTEFRASLSTKTLESIMIEKLSMDCCYKKTFTNQELKNAKCACCKELNSND